MDLAGSVALVTGAGRGIGEAIASALAEGGARVLVCDSDLTAAEATAQTLGQERAFAIECDVSDADAVTNMVGEAVARFGRLDILVNNAGISVVKSFLNLTLAEWERVMQVNLTGTFLCGQAAARAMRAQAYGRIINITSISGQRGGTGRAAYGASKGAVTALTKVMAVELATDNITVNAVAPGPVMTELAARTHSEATISSYRQLVPMQRYGKTSEVAAAVRFLASKEASYITGHTINVDGGFKAAGLIFPL